MAKEKQINQIRRKRGKQRKNCRDQRYWNTSETHNMTWLHMKNTEEKLRWGTKQLQQKPKKQNSQTEANQPPQM